MSQTQQQPTERRSGDRKAEILAAACELLQTQGYAGFSYQDLSTRLGIAKPSIHHHFPTKESLGVAIVQSYADRLAQMCAALEQQAQTPGDQLRLFFEFADAEASSQERSICPGGALHGNYENFPESVQDAARSLSEHMHGWLSSLLHRGRESGEVRFLGSPEDEAWALMSILQGGRQHSRTHGIEVWRAVVRQVSSSLLGTS